MKNLKQELIDFLKWYDEADPHLCLMPHNHIIEKYLKSINSPEPVERRAIGENESQRKDCFTCKYEHSPASEIPCFVCSKDYDMWEQSV